MRRSIALAAVVSLLGLALAPAAAAIPAPGAAPTGSSPNVESAWEASFGPGMGDVSVRAFDTGAGSIVLSLRRLDHSTDYAAALYGGTCPVDGSRVVALGKLTSNGSGKLSITQTLDRTQVAAIRAAASGTNRVSVAVGTGSKALCATLVKSLDVTPQIWFGPLPVTTSGWMVHGATDYAALFDDDAPWAQVAGRTHVFIFQGWWLDGTYVSTAELRRMIDALKARQIRIAIDWYALQPEDGCGVDVNGFGTGADGLLRVLRTIRSLGGTVDYVSIDEPFSGGVLWDGPNACHWSVATVATKVAAQVARVRAEFPGIRFGLMEGYNGPPWIDYVKQWISACEAAVGERLPFLHLDTDYTAPGWADGAAQIQQYVRSRGTRFGVHYTTWPPAATDAEWFAGATANMNAFELEGAGPPDDAVFMVWTDKPDHVLPETGATTMTRLIADYIRMRTVASVTGTPSPAGGTIAVTGTLRTLGGDPVVGASVVLTATPRDGQYQILEFAGTVPADAVHALIAIGANAEGVGPGPADLTFYEIGYSEGNAGVNLVPNARFDYGLLDWDKTSGTGSLTVVPSERGGSKMRMVVTPDQWLYSASGSFSVTPGAAFRTWAAVRVPEASMGNAYIAPVFFKDVIGTTGWTEVRRDIHPLGPVTTVGTTVTNATGAYALTMSSLEPGRYWLLAEYAGDGTYWPARARTEVTVP